GRPGRRPRGPGVGCGRRSERGGRTALFGADGGRSSAVLAGHLAALLRPPGRRDRAAEPTAWAGVVRAPAPLALPSDAVHAYVVAACVAVGFRIFSRTRVASLIHNVHRPVAAAAGLARVRRCAETVCPDVTAASGV